MDIGMIKTKIVPSIYTNVLLRNVNLSRPIQIGNKFVSRLSDEEQREICARYQAGQTGTQIAEAYQFTPTGVYDILERHGIPRHNRLYKLTQVDQDAICLRYQAGESSSSLGKAFGVWGATVIRVLRVSGIPRRPPPTWPAIYKANHHFFDKISSENSAYWLGFLAADGYVSADNAITLSLARKDREHVVAFQQAIGATHPVVDRTCKTSYGTSMQSKFYMRSPRLARALRRLGFTHNKTTNCPWPKMPERLRHHFVRGYVDGDGGFYVSRLKHYRDGTPRKLVHYVFRFSVTSHITFIETLQQWLSRTCNISINKLDYRRPGRPFPSLTYSGRNIVGRIYHCLYANATIWLPRKRLAIAQGLQETITPRYVSKLNHAQAQEIRERYATGTITNAKLAEEYGVAKSTIVWITTGKHWRMTAS